MIVDPTIAPARVDRALAGLDAWLDTMRGPGGYGGPVAHWWQQSLLYGGPGLDWRYEGIIAGYVELWRRGGDARWLAKARRAGDDLLAGQDSAGHFAASGFEANPSSAGTPHEAAADAGLLALALALREARQAGWEQYADAAERNLRQFYLAKLWDEATASFRDSPGAASFVPNKAATVCEALFLLADLRADANWVERYALPTLRRVVEYQVSAGKLRGAIAQNSIGNRRIEKYFPIYIARCVPALAQGYRRSGDERLMEAARLAVDFLRRWSEDDGSVPAVVYSARRSNEYPRWIAPLGDVLRAAAAVGEEAAFAGTLEVLLSGQSGSGGIRTASGFAATAGGKAPVLPDFRDLLPVVGWCDKAFRYLATLSDGRFAEVRAGSSGAACTLRGRKLIFLETLGIIEAHDRQGVCYRWRKGQLWAEIAQAEFWLK